MTRILPWLCLLLLAGAALAQKAPDQRRLLRIESRVYGWYGVAEPGFDKTIGRRELFKISGGDNFLKGLDGRLVVLQGQFSEGELKMGSLAPPPLSVPEGARRQRFTLTSGTAPGGLGTSDGYLLRGSGPELAPGSTADLVVAPGTGGELTVLAVLSSADSPSPPVTSAPLPSNSTLQGGAMLELEMTQAFVDGMVDVGRDRAGLKAGYQGITLQASQLRVILPDGASAPDAPWRLEGTVELGFSGTGTLAESSFVISARPSISGNVLSLAPNWEEIKLEGQLPFGFALDARMLGQLKAYLPAQVPVLNLDWISSYLRSQGLLTAEEQVEWFLGGGGAGTLRLGLGSAGSALGSSSRALPPGGVRLQLSAGMADRLVRRGVQTFLNPETPFVPNPPITVGQVLFVSIKVEQVFLRSLQSGYSNGVFRFRDLVVDVAWRAGPLSGTEPLLSTTGYIVPRLSAVQADGSRYWDWTVKIESLTVRSEKIPGNKDQLAAELIPRLERELGTELAQKQKVPARLPLSMLVQTPAAANGYLEVTEVRPLDASLEVEGRLVR